MFGLLGKLVEDVGFTGAGVTVIHELPAGNFRDREWDSVLCKSS